LATGQYTYDELTILAYNGVKEVDLTNPEEFERRREIVKARIKKLAVEARSGKYPGFRIESLKDETDQHGPSRYTLVHGEVKAPDLDSSATSMPDEYSVSDTIQPQTVPNGEIAAKHEREEKAKKIPQQRDLAILSLVLKQSRNQIAETLKTRGFGERISMPQIQEHLDQQYVGNELVDARKLTDEQRAIVTETLDVILARIEKGQYGQLYQIEKRLVDHYRNNIIVQKFVSDLFKFLLIKHRKRGEPEPQNVYNVVRMIVAPPRPKEVTE
jgi:hypothetical protein